MLLQEVTNQKLWDDLAVTHWQHTWEYGCVQELSNRIVSRYIITDNNETIGFFQMVTYPLCKNKTISYLPYGPVFFNKQIQKQLQGVEKMLHNLGQEKNSILVRAELPNNNVFSKLPLFAYQTSFHQARGEVVLQITKNVSDNFSKSTKRNIKKASKNNLQTNFYHGHDIVSQLNNFLSINAANTASHGTTTHDKTYFTNLFDVLSQNDNNFVATVYDEHANSLAINIFTVFNEICYCPFGASTDAGKKLGAYYQIKHDSIGHMQKNGISEFNWGGISIGKNDKNLSALNSFKLGFGGKEKHHNDLYDVVISPVWYYLYLLRSWIKK